MSLCLFWGDWILGVDNFLVQHVLGFENHSDTLFREVSAILMLVIHKASRSNYPSLLDRLEHSLGVFPALANVQLG